MFSSIPTLRAELDELLAASVPGEWVIVRDLTAASVGLAPAVYIEFNGLDSTLAGEPLGRGTVAASVDLVLVDPRTADGVAEAAVEQLVVPLLHALDTHDDLAWSKAAKVRLDSGPFAWRISLTTLVTL